MPRFKFNTGVALKDTLTAMGMPEAFSLGADFSGINGGRDLHVQSVIHKAIIAVDEKGTTAAAATGVVVGTTSLPPQLRADRPFLFFIRHDPDRRDPVPGRVVDPRSNSPQAACPSRPSPAGVGKREGRKKEAHAARQPSPRPAERGEGRERGPATAGAAAGTRAAAGARASGRRGGPAAATWCRPW